MLSKVSEFIHAHHLINPEDKVLVALSGGSDSVALLLVLHELGYKIEALHCNFHLRGDESDRDENFVRHLCESMNIPLLTKDFLTENYAREHKISIEMAARDLRYGWFREEVARNEAQCIAVGHHRDDQAETFLINLIRGTGIRGLCGMAPANGCVVRPLLCVSRQEILDYLATKGQDFVTDSTNLERIALRNRIRLDVLPLLRTLNPRIDEKLVDTSNYIRLYHDFFMTQTSESHPDITPERFSVPSLTPEVPLLLHEWLHRKGFNHAQEKEMLASLSVAESKNWYSATHRIVKCGRSFCIYPTEAETRIPQLQQEIIERPKTWQSGCAYFDADLLTQPLTIRHVCEGDRMQPFGMQGTKLLSDLMRELGLDLVQRKRQFVICHGEEILWMVGHRTSNLYRVTPQTRRILRLSIKTSDNEPDINNDEP